MKKKEVNVSICVCVCVDKERDKIGKDLKENILVYSFVTKVVKFETERYHNYTKCIFTLTASKLFNVVTNDKVIMKKR